MHHEIFGYTWEEIKTFQQKGSIDRTIKSTLGDYGSDPIGNGKFKMVPSGDIVDFEERQRRLK